MKKNVKALKSISFPSAKQVQSSLNLGRKKQAKMAEEENPVKASFAKPQSMSGTCDYTCWKTFRD